MAFYPQKQKGHEKKCTFRKRVDPILILLIHIHSCTLTIQSEAEDIVFSASDWDVPFFIRSPPKDPLNFCWRSLKKKIRRVDFLAAPLKKKLFHLREGSQVKNPTISAA